MWFCCCCGVGSVVIYDVVVRFIVICGGVVGFVFKCGVVVGFVFTWLHTEHPEYTHNTPA